jgi:amino acid adenylation domain-containing protein
VTTLTYRELDDRAELLASAMRARGVAPGTRVGVCVDRGVELVTVLLAVLKAGAAYVPMDVRAPTDRLAFTVRDARPELVVTDVADFPTVEGVPLLPPDALLATGSAGAPGTGPTGRRDDPAYVIYTSGSTGRPKGVIVPHRNVLALLDATAGDMRLGPGDTWTLFHSSAFDFSVWEIWGCLLTGGRLVCVPYWVSRSPEEFRELLARERVTVLSQTPSAFNQLREVDAEAGAAADAADLAVRLVVFGGEPLDATTLRAWYRRHPRTRLVNMFGITETTVHVTTHTVTAADIASGSRSVGTALPGWSVSVRDERGRPLPFGAPGEIYVGGAGVADGYLNREELTRERFRTDGYTGATVYRSGDRGRLRPDGQLEHLGRMDNQVQLRGHRVEPDEVRAVLLEDPHVRAAAVVVAGGPAGARLEAYVVLDGGSAAEVRRRAARMLPEYMLPSTVTALPELPLTLNGKLDVDALPAPHQHDAVHPPAATVGGDQPDGFTGTMIRIWGGVFGRAITADDDFFELGGNSLLAVRLFAAQRAAGLPRISLNELYLRPTISGLADVMAQAPSGA